jgi:hypothetical protein
MTDAKMRLRELLEVKDSWILAAFYSDPQVSALTEELTRRWIAANRVGEPLDYATDEEARTLLAIAERYAYMHPDRARAVALSRMAGEEESSSESSSLWSRIIGGVKRRGSKRAS